MEFYSECTSATENFAYEIAGKLTGGEVITLDGDLGAGKTAFVRGLAKGLGAKETVSSPTFTIVNEYRSGRLPLFHFDVYRLSDVDEFYAIGGEEYFSNGICIIEWGEIIESILPTNYLKISFRKSDEDDSVRYMDFHPHSSRFEIILEGMFKN